MLFRSVNTKTENIGARRLHTIMTTLLEQPLFEHPKKGQKKLKITAKYVKEALGDIVFDEDLSPVQIRNFQKLNKDVRFIDRTGIILEIFYNNAKSKESRTQVELARLEYQLPRLTRLWTHLERQMGGFGTRAGAGETQIEVDRRIKIGRAHV